MGPIQETAPAESTHGPIEHEQIDHEVIVEPVEVHINELNDGVVRVEPNFNLGEQLSAYQKNEGLELSQLGFFNALFGLYTREEDCQKDCEASYTEKTEKYTEATYTEKPEEYTEEIYTKKPEEYTEETYTKKPEEYTEETYTKKPEGYSEETYT